MMKGKEKPPPWWFEPAVLAGMAGTLALIFAVIGLAQ